MQHAARNFLPAIALFLQEHGGRIVNTQAPPKKIVTTVNDLQC